MRRPRRKDQGGGEDPPYEGSSRDHKAGGKSQNKTREVFPIHTKIPPQYIFVSRKNEIKISGKTQSWLTPAPSLRLEGPSKPSALAARSEWREEHGQKKKEKLGKCIPFSAALPLSSALPLPLFFFHFLFLFLFFFLFFPPCGLFIGDYHDKNFCAKEYPPQPGHHIKISNIGKPKPTEERGTMFEWLCIFCLFSYKFTSPNPPTDQTLF
jgi:hypothetical protein